MNGHLLSLALLLHALCCAQSPQVRSQVPPNLSKRAAIDLAHASADQRIQAYEVEVEERAK